MFVTPGPSASLPLLLLLLLLLPTPLHSFLLLSLPLLMHNHLRWRLFVEICNLRAHRLRQGEKVLDLLPVLQLPHFESVILCIQPKDMLTLLEQKHLHVAQCLLQL